MLDEFLSRKTFIRPLVISKPTKSSKGLFMGPPLVFS